MSMIVQFQGPNGPIFVHRDNIVTIATTPQLGLMAQGRPSSTTVLTLDTGATLTINDDPLHAAEKWEKAFAEDFDDLDEAFSDDDDDDDDDADEARLAMAERQLLGVLLEATDDPRHLPSLADLDGAFLQELRIALEEWAAAQHVDGDDDADDEEDDDADA